MRNLLVLLAASVVLASSSPVEAADPAWDDDWRSVGPQEAAIIAGSAASIATMQLILEEPAEPRWIGPVLLDDGARNLFLSEGAGVDTAGLFSDIFLFTLIGYTVGIDSVGVAGIGHGEWNSALQTSAIAVQSHTLNALVTMGLKYAIARRRPGFGACYDDPYSDGDCAKRPNVSMPSGHTSTAFTGAGLVCVTHEFIDYYGGIGDQLACYSALAMATATGLLRIASNNHYLSDIVVGGLIGITLGYFIPKAVYFGRDEEPDVGLGQEALSPPPVLQFGGTF